MKTMRWETWRQASVVESSLEQHGFTVHAHWGHQQSKRGCVKEAQVCKPHWPLKVLEAKKVNRIEDCNRKGIDGGSYNNSNKS